VLPGVNAHAETAHTGLRENWPSDAHFRFAFGVRKRRKMAARIKRTHSVQTRVEQNFNVPYKWSSGYRLLKYFCSQHHARLPSAASDFRDDIGVQQQKRTAKRAGQTGSEVDETVRYGTTPK
jgi:hypothetical protein